MADALDLGSSAFSVQVQVLSPVPLLFFKEGYDVNGSITVSKTACSGSNPDIPAIHEIIY
jgi:hypothetical protein